MEISNEMAGRLCKRLIREYGFSVAQAADCLGVMMDVFAEVPDPNREVCDGAHDGPCPAWHDGVDGLRERLKQAETKLACVWACLNEETHPIDRLAKITAILAESSNGGAHE